MTATTRAAGPILTVLAVLAAACTSSSAPSSGPTTSELTSGPTTTIPTSRHQLYIATASGPFTVNATVGDVVDVELSSNRYHPDHSLANWSVPTSSDPAVLAATDSDPVPCPSDTVCTSFRAATPGTALVTAEAPSGILCDETGNRCVGVSVARWRGISVNVRS